MRRRQDSLLENLWKLAILLFTVRLLARRYRRA